MIELMSPAGVIRAGFLRCGRHHLRMNTRNHLWPALLTSRRNNVEEISMKKLIIPLAASLTVFGSAAMAAPQHKARSTEDNPTSSRTPGKQVTGLLP